MESRNTLQRQIVLEAVRELASHPTAQEVYDSIALRHPSISRATVYRNLKVLADSGALYAVASDRGPARFDHRTDCHYHAICNVCGGCEDVEVSDFSFKQEARNGFKIHGHALVFNGICKKCAEK